MTKILLTEIAKACDGELFNINDDIVITGITSDSRLVKNGVLFAAIRGAKVDGHNFIPVSVENGAAAVIGEKLPTDSETPFVLVKSTIVALQRIATYIIKRSEIPVVAIAGSVGKTSTKEMIASVLSQKYKVLKTEGNHNNALGLPLTIFNIEDDDEVAVLEMGISNFGEMHTLVSIAKPDICVMTNIGDCHIEFLGDREGVYRAKSEMFDYLSFDDAVVLNGDDKILSRQREIKGVRAVFYGMGDTCDVYADNIERMGFDGTNCTIHFGNNVINAHIQIPGMHMVYNALAAATVGNMLGLEPCEIKSGIEAARTISGRFNVIHTDNMTIIDDCYNAGCASMKASLTTLSEAKGRKVAILGDMGELGDKSRELHEEVGAFAATCGIDVLLCAGSECKYMAEAAKNTVDSFGVYCYATRDELISDLGNVICDGDTVLVKASHFMEFGKVVESLKEM